MASRTKYQHEEIIKDLAPGGPTPNLVDYAQACASFSWEQAQAELAGPSTGHGLNIAYEAVDWHAAGERASHIALRFLSRLGPPRDLSYSELGHEANRFANALASLGVTKGDRVFSLLGRVPELYVTAIGTWKLGAVFSPLFSAFGPEPIRQRIALGEGRVLVTNTVLFQRKVSDLLAVLPMLEYIVLVGDLDADELPPPCLSWTSLIGAAGEDFATLPTDSEDAALLHFTSGTTGMPKGALHVHQAVVAHRVTGAYALDLHPDDVFWCTADPGWVTGTSYGIISPLVHGTTAIVDEAEFDAARWYEILEHERVTVWYTAPTALRMLMRVGGEMAKQHDLSCLRFIASVGEPLNPQVVLWANEALGLPVHDNWWQTETGGIMIANFASMNIRPGSMGRPLPGVIADIARRDQEGALVVHENEIELITDPEDEGELVLRPGWPSMFRGYFHDSPRYANAFVDGWYRTGDLVRRDRDGYYWFVGRGDDVIKSAGHLIGPFEVESALLEHPAVAEAAVIGLPDPVVGEVVKAFVTLRPGFLPSNELRLEILGWGRKRLGTAVAPKEIAFDPSLPHTTSGKIMRRVLRARELGLEEGDLSTLEERHD